MDRKAATRAGTIAGVDGLTSAMSAGIANKLLKIGKQATFGRRMAGGLAAAGVENSLGMVGGSTGEFLAQLFSGQEIDLKAIEAEGLGELFGLPGAVGGVGLKAMFGGPRGEVLNWEGSEQNGRSVVDAQGIREAEPSNQPAPANALPPGSRAPTEEELADWIEGEGLYETLPGGPLYHRESGSAYERPQPGDLVMTPEGMMVIRQLKPFDFTRPRQVVGAVDESGSSLEGPAPSDSLGDPLAGEQPARPEEAVPQDPGQPPVQQEAPKPDEPSSTTPENNEDGASDGQDHPRQLRPEDWQVERPDIDARESARVGAETIQEVHGRLPVEERGSTERAWREVQAPSEIAAVAAGRKPVFHGEAGPSAQAFAEALDAAYPGLGGGGIRRSPDRGGSGASGRHRRY